MVTSCWLLNLIGVDVEIDTIGLPTYTCLIGGFLPISVIIGSYFHSNLESEKKVRPY